MTRSNPSSDSLRKVIEGTHSFFVKQISEKVVSWAPTPSACMKPCSWTTAQILYSLMSNICIYDSCAKKSLEWLVQQQNPNGSWGSVAYGPLGDVPATACCVVTLFQSQGRTSITALQGCNWLCRTFNHGWTTQPTLEEQKFQPFHLYSTAYALRALVRGPREPMNSLCIQEGMTILIRSQTKEGGWGFQPDLPADPTFTSYVLHGLLDVRDIWGLPVSDDVVDKAIKWLTREQNPHGSWREWQGVAQSPEATGYCMYVMLKSGLNIVDEAIEGAIEWLFNNRHETGGWMLDPLHDNECNNWVTHSVLLGLEAHQASMEVKPKEIIDTATLTTETRTTNQILRKWLYGKKNHLSYLCKRFSGYRSEFGHPEFTWDNIADWLLQFSVENLENSKMRIKLALKLIEHIRYITVLQITNGIMKILASIIPKLPSPHFVCPLGGLKDSSANYFYALDKLREKMKLEISLATLRDVLSSSPGPGALIFIDDILISGTQAGQMLDEMLLGRRTNGQLVEYYLTPLTTNEIGILRSIEIVYIPYLADIEGKRRVEEYAHSTRFNLNLTVEPYFTDNSRCFDLGEVYIDNLERIMARDMIQEIGYELLSEIAEDKGWTDEERLKSSLGYGSFQKLLVLDRNIPRVSLPILWCEGHWRGRAWCPLFEKK